ncbi:cytochrome P450 [Chaetomium fimeti]|uniref:Cytochrome P450 n=1 Tax=Chaetomium fimeti TaxID=1854472 RepID=A0AAE0LP17_9PEZI|nr:cytochrome P450 [Chaetomium fimeti]
MGTLSFFDLTWTWSPWLLWVAASATVASAIGRSVYLLYFHPAAKFPGPKLAAISYIPYCYHWIRGRYPWFQEQVLREYGHVVRVGPNELVFFTPQAATDIYGASVKHQEVFLKTDLMDFGAGDLGFIWESDPAKRKAVAKKILPAFSSKATKEKEPLVHAYLDLFVRRMKEVGGRPEGLPMNDWLLWLAIDMAADLAYGRELTHLKDGKTSDFVETIRGTSFVGTLVQLSKRVTIIGLLAPVFVPLRVMRSIPAVFKANKAEVQARIDKRGKTKHPDFMDYMISPEDPPPASKKELTHIEQVAFQMFIAGFDPVQITFYAVLFFLLKSPKARAILTEEIRSAFESYEDITPEALARLKYLNAFIHETLRVHLTTPTGMPRLSPGAVVDGVYVPKGIVVQLSSFTAMRHERYFADPLEFRPERWLPADHALYDTRYANDNLKAFFPFSLGPRQCTGREIAWSQTRLFLAKVLWTFELEGVRGHDKSFDDDFSVHVMWNRPELYVRFVPR